MNLVDIICPPPIGWIQIMQGIGGKVKKIWSYIKLMLCNNIVRCDSEIMWERGGKVTPNEEHKQVIKKYNC